MHGPLWIFLSAYTGSLNSLYPTNGAIDVVGAYDGVCVGDGCVGDGCVGDGRVVALAIVWAGVADVPDVGSDWRLPMATTCSYFSGVWGQYSESNGYFAQYCAFDIDDKSRRRWFSALRSKYVSSDSIVILSKALSPAYGSYPFWALSTRWVNVVSPIVFGNDAGFRNEFNAPCASKAINANAPKIILFLVIICRPWFVIHD